MNAVLLAVFAVLCVTQVTAFNEIQQGIDYCASKPFGIYDNTADNSCKSFYLCTLLWKSLGYCGPFMSFDARLGWCTFSAPCARSGNTSVTQGNNGQAPNQQSSTPQVPTQAPVASGGR